MAYRIGGVQANSALHTPLRLEYYGFLTTNGR